MTFTNNIIINDVIYKGDDCEIGSRRRIKKVKRELDNKLKQF